MRFVWCVLVLSLVVASPLAAQRRPAAIVDTDSLNIAPVPVSTARLVIGGAAGGVVGLFGGAALGHYLETRDCGVDPMGSNCGLAGTILGGAAGEALLLPLGVHLANRGRGSLLWPTVASSAAAVGMLLLAGQLENPVLHTPVFLGTPLVQLGVAVWVQRMTP